MRKKEKKTISHYQTPFVIIDKRIDFHWLTKDKWGYVFGIVIDKKREYQLCISPKGNKVKVFKVL